MYVYETWLCTNVASAMTQLLSYQRGSMMLHFTGGRVIGINDGKQVGKNSPGHRWRASTNKSPIRTLCNKGARTFESRFLLAFCGQMNTSRESPVTKSVLLLLIYPEKNSDLCSDLVISFAYYFRGKKD